VREAASALWHCGPRVRSLGCAGGVLGCSRGAETDKLHGPPTPGLAPCP